MAKRQKIGSPVSRNTHGRNGNGNKNGGGGLLFDMSIRGDELEQNRIQLENNLQNNTNLSFRLSPVSEDEDQDHEKEGDHPYSPHEHDHDSSVEYPRHNSHPRAFRSFEMPSRSLEYDHSAGHGGQAWSYRTMEDDDDDEGINPYAGETMSTAAHHASALTLSAGLGGRAGARRRDEISVSGAEYDPERRVRDMLAGVGVRELDSRFSMFDIEASRSKYAGMPGSTTTSSFAPLVVDTTADLDRVLQTGYAPAHAPLVPSPVSPLPLSSSASSSSNAGSDNESNRSASARPKLSDALRHVSFSPQRPRSPRVHGHAGRDTPGRARGHTSQPQQPQVRLHPPTPTSSNPNVNQSQFTKMANGIRGEIETAASRATRASSRQNKDQERERNPFDVTATAVNTLHNASLGGTRNQAQTPARPSALKQRVATPGPKGGRVYLPDVTGLTSAVESPAKAGGGGEYLVYRADEGRSREIEARLLATLNTVQSKLSHLEAENGISRRRVRELERELDVCKAEVGRERTRVLEREEVARLRQGERDRERDRQAQGEGRNGRGKDYKGKARARDVDVVEERGMEDMHGRYREAVEEKKALEALLSTLRTHLTRLTAELSSHRALLTELRELRDADVGVLQRKSNDVERLGREVERLGGEVEVLRGVVEEGLRERRGAREVEAADIAPEADRGMSLDDEDDDDDEGQGEEEHHMQNDEEHRENGVGEIPEEEQNEEQEPFDPVSIPGSSRLDIVNDNANKTIRTDYATMGSSLSPQSTPLPRSPRQAQFIDETEFERISMEVEERRERERERERERVRPSRRATVRDASEDDIERVPAEQERHGSPGPRTRAYMTSGQPQGKRNIPAPTPSRAKERPHPVVNGDEAEVQHTPFPQIRGSRLERLFFSAPEHDKRTCGMCRRRRRADAGGVQYGVYDDEDEDEGREEGEKSWVPERFRRRAGVRGDEGSPEERDGDDDEVEVDEDEDEGFAEGSDQQYNPDVNERRRKGKGKVAFTTDAGTWKLRAQREGLPPQTVVARVISELEDDFTHYKGIYVEFADQYKDMDPVADVPRRNLLAKHLREVVDILEQKGDQIAALYDLLSFKDKPVGESAIPSRPSSSNTKNDNHRTRMVSTTAVASSSLGRNTARRSQAAFA